mgnify:FL=1
MPDESSAPITFTIDVEDYAPAGEEVRAVAIVDSILERLSDRAITGTFFIVGELARAHPTMVERIAAAGHEVGLHGWVHVPFPELAPDVLAEHLRRGRGELEDISGQSVEGVRAPTFSLVPEAHHALDLVLDAGFRYSSSVLPARSPLFGDPTAPRHAFRWPNGLVELPCPILEWGRIALPYLGGTYLRVLPRRIAQLGLRRATSDEILWLYCHPYDFDPDEPFRPRPELGRIGTRVMWVGRRSMFDRVEACLHGRVGRPLCDRARAITA